MKVKSKVFVVVTLFFVAFSVSALIQPAFASYKHNTKLCYPVKGSGHSCTNNMKYTTDNGTTIANAVVHDYNFQSNVNLYKMVLIPTVSGGNSNPRFKNFVVYDKAGNIKYNNSEYWNKQMSNYPAINLYPNVKKGKNTTVTFMTDDAGACYYQCVQYTQATEFEY